MKILYLMLFCVLSFSCASQYQLEENPPEWIGESYFQKTIGGREESPEEIKVVISVKTEDVVLEKLYFRNKVVPLKKIEPKKYAAVFLFPKNPDLIMSAEAQEEYGNRVYENPEFPFDLKEDEAVIGFLVGNKTKFFKIENLPEKATQYMPGRNRENN